MLVGRFMRGYGYTRAQVLAEPALSFFALLAALPKLQAEEDMRALMVAGAGANPGEKGDAFNKVMDSLRAQAGQTERGRAVPDGQRIAPGLAPGASFEDQPGEIAELRARQRANAERVRREWEEQQRQRRGV